MSVASPTGRVLSRVLRGCRCKRSAGWTGISAGPPLPSKHPYRPLAARLEAAADLHRVASTAMRLLRGYYEATTRATTRLPRGPLRGYYGATTGPLRGYYRRSTTRLLQGYYQVTTRLPPQEPHVHLLRIGTLLLYRPPVHTFYNINNTILHIYTFCLLPPR